MTAKTGSPYKIDIEPTLFVSSIGLLVALLSALVYLPLNNYHMTKAWGYYLISIYVVCMIFNVILESQLLETID